MIASGDARWALDALESLREKSLLEVRAGGARRMRLLEPIRQFALRRGEEAALSAARARHLDWYARFGEEDRLASLYTHGGAARRRALALEGANLRAAAAWGLSTGRSAAAAQAQLALCAMIYLRGPFRAAVEAAGQALDAGGLSPRLEARLRQTRGEAARVSGDRQLAQEDFERALAICRGGALDPAEARRHEGYILGNLGILLADQNRQEDARARYEEALALHRANGERRGEGRALINLGILHLYQGRMDEALERLTEALAIRRAIGDRRGEGIAVSNLGILRFHQGRLEAAGPRYEAALAIHRGTGDRGGEATVLGNLGVLRFHQGRVEEAEAHYEASLAIHRALGDRRGVAHDLGNLGNLLVHRGRLDAAEARYLEALAVRRGLGDRRGEGYDLGNLGSLYLLRGELLPAEARLKVALAIHRAGGERGPQAGIRIDQGVICLQRGQVEAAAERFREALAVYRAIGDRRGEGVALGHLGALEGSREALTRAERLLGEVGDVAALGRLHCQRGELERRAGDPDDAQARLEAARGCAARCGAGPGSPLDRAIGRLESPSG